MAGQESQRLSSGKKLTVPKIGMFMFIVSNLAGSSIQITTLPLPVLSTLQAVCATSMSILRAHAYVGSLDWSSIRAVPL